MTVLEVCAYAAPYEGNFIKSLRALAKELEKSGDRMAFAFPENARGIDWVVELGKEYDLHFLPLAKARILPRTYRLLKKIYRQYSDLKIIHSHFELYDVPVTLTAPKGVAVYWHLHDAIQVYSDLKNRIVHKLQYGFFKGKSVLLSVSQKHMEYVVGLGFSRERALWIPNGLDTSRIKLASKPFEERAYDFLIFGWEYWRKGVDLSILAAQKTGERLRLGIVCEEATEREIAEQFGAVDGVCPVKPVKDINELYNETKCFLHISRAEGLSYALLEAVYAGLPVICSDIEENRFASAFPTVHMVKNEDVDAIAGEMIRRLEEGDASEENKAASRRRIDEEYSIGSWVRRMKGLYEQHLG